MPGASRALTGLGLALLLAACAVSESDPVVRTDYDPGTSFAGYHSFAWTTDDPIVVTSMQPLAPTTRSALLEETAAQLETKGLRQVASASDADMTVAFVLGSQDSLQENVFPGSISPVGTVGRDYRESTDVREVTTGALAIEIFQQPSGQRVWTGWATTGLTMDVYANSAETIREMVSLILEKFPPPAS